MHDEFPERMKRCINTMPSLPTTIFKVIEICDNPRTSPMELNRVISLDPVLTARVLKLINMAYDGINHQTMNLVRAIIMLGLNTVKNVALSSSVVQTSLKEKGKSCFNMQAFWQHSLGVGVTAKLLAKKRGIDRKYWASYFCAGFLHDIGKLPFDTVFAEGYVNAIITAEQERNPLFHVEDRLFNMNHCYMGEVIADLWKLDGELRDMIAYHHTYSEYNGPYKDKLFTVVAANNYVTISKIGFSGNTYLAEVEPMVLEELKISRDMFLTMEKEILIEIEKAQIFLKI
ncbi:MAG: HDOD domain-containing protein [Treponema sp.]|jgi:putative nucleotidyltransferase with HDIG domain|nr:HDOD domain-containing protein [Treponema sp.]